MTTRVLACLLAALLAAGAAHAQIGATAARSGTGAIEYVTGGIGSDQMEQLKAREKDFNLKLVFTLVEGNYLSDVNVAIKDAGGKPLLTVNAQGPIVLAKLPRGSYTVEATYEGKAQTRKVAVAERLRTEYLRWPSNPETDSPGPKRTE
jgi:hypothetical protein